MTEKTKIDATDLQKALTSLQELAKGHNSRGTATTEVPAMTGESGPTQVFHTASNSAPGSWAGSSWESLDWSDSIGPDGTDLRAAGAKMRKSILEKIAKGAALTQGERNFVAKGGLDMFKDADEGTDDKKDKKPSMEKAQASHPDEAEDKKLIKEMMDKKEKEEKKDDVSKSFNDYAAESEAVSKGFEVSEFLAGFAEVMHKSLVSMERRITDRVLGAIAKSDAEHGEVSKSMAEALSTLGEVLSLHAQRLEQVEAGPARAPKSASIVKSIGGAPEISLEDMSKSQVVDVLVDLMQKGQVSQKDVLKYDATGELSPELKARVIGRR